MNEKDVLKKELVALLEGGNAHMSFAEAVADFPLDRINDKPPNCPYSFWHLVEHIRIAQWDILEFIVNPKHVSPPWPAGYRPKPEEKTDPEGWRSSVEAVLADIESLKRLVLDPEAQLFAPIPHAPDYTLFREILLAADHNSHHVGEFAMMRQIQNLWPTDKPYLTGKA